MSVTAFQDLPLAGRDREWDGAAAENRVRQWAHATDEPNEKYRDAHVWYDGDKKDNFTAYKLLIADVIDDRLTAVPRGVMAAAEEHVTAHVAILASAAGLHCRFRAAYPVRQTPRWSVRRRTDSHRTSDL